MLLVSFRKNTISLLALVAILTACNNNNAEKTVSTRSSFFDTSAMNSSIKAGDNFWMYANGGWYNKAIIPPTENGVGGFYELINNTRDKLKKVLDEVIGGAHKQGTIEQQIADFYSSGMDTTAIDKRGFSPLKLELEKINQLASPAAIMEFVATQQAENNSFLFQPYIATDDKNSTIYLLNFYQGGLGLPDRDYYFKTDAATVETVAAYKNFVKKLFSLTGDDTTTATANTKAVFELEKQMAAAHKTNVELRDPQANYNKMAVADLDKKYPSLQWSNVLKIMKAPSDSVNIAQPAFFAKLNSLVATVPLDIWKKYFRAQLLEATAGILSKDFEQAAFAYYGTALRGEKEMKPRWQKMTEKIDAQMGDALGQLYVKKYFTEDAKKRMMELVDNLATALEARINKLDWMSDSTKKTAIQKLHSFTRKIGFPDKWKDYSSIKIDKTLYFENLTAFGQFEYNYQINKLGKPVDRTEWAMSPPTINAYYNPGFNEIVFPAGILQFPFFDFNADDAINYGGIGMVIGHEMTHAFDDQGAQYDKDGNLKNWWAIQDLDKFTAKGKKLIDLYHSFTVLDSMHVNGQLTQGENTADFGGIAIAYDAFKLTKQGKDSTKIDGFTPDQRFFLSFAQIWRSKLTDARLRQQVNTDPHSPAMHRVNGPLMNFEPFYKAFNVKLGDKMYLPAEERLKIW